MSDTHGTHGTSDGVQLRKAPTTPGPLIAIGGAAALIGAFALATDTDGGLMLGVVLLWIGGILGGVGIIAMGVLVGTRRANYEEYLERLIEDTDQ